MFDWVLNTPLSVRGEDSSTLRKKCLNTEFFLVSIFPFSDSILRFNTLISVFSSNTGKCGPEKTPYLDTFHTVPMIAKVDGKHRGPPGGSWVSVGGIAVGGIEVSFI